MAEERVQRRLAAILAADVVGYSRHMRENEAGTLAQLKALRKELLEPKVAEYGGRIVKTTGDGALIEFPSAVDAVQHAIDVQLTLARRNAENAGVERFELRMGINVGDVIVEGDDLYGDGVNVAARLEGLAEPGGTCISSSVYEQVRHKLEIEYDDLGDQLVKNIPDPIHVYRLVMDVSEERPATAASIEAMFRRPAIAVLPFENLSGDPDQEYFADGLTEDIITALSLWRSFPVIARNSTFAYKGTSPDVRQVGHELGVRYVVEGSVRRSNDRVRITAQLINAESGHHIWAERFDRNIADFFDLQDEISQRIGAIIHPEIERAERQSFAHKPPNNFFAWELCVQGFAHIHEVTKDGHEKAREIFLRAIDADPHYSRGYAGLAWVSANELRFFWGSDPEKSRDLLLENARRAATLDENDAEARIMLARAYLQHGQKDSALAEARSAVRLNPNNSMANNMMGTALAIVGGRYAEGIPWYEKAVLLNPTDPRKWIYLSQLALSHLGNGEPEKAIQFAEEAVHQQLEVSEPLITLAATLGYLGRTSEAAEILERVGDDATEFVEKHTVYCDDLKEVILGGLRKADMRD